MTPAITALGPGDGRLVDAVLSGQLDLPNLPAQAANPRYIGSRKSGSIVLFSASEIGEIGRPRKRVTSLSVHVDDIVPLRAEEEMLRVHARRVVTGMQNALSGGNGALEQHPRQPVRLQSAPRDSVAPDTRWLGSLSEPLPAAIVGQMDTGANFFASPVDSPHHFIISTCSQRGQA